MVWRKKALIKWNQSTRSKNEHEKSIASYDSEEKKFNWLIAYDISGDLVKWIEKQTITMTRQIHK